MGPGVTFYKNDLPLVIINSILTAVVIGLVLARVYVRIKLLKSFRADDHLIVIALVWALANYGLTMTLVLQCFATINDKVSAIEYRRRANLLNRIFQTITSSTTSQNLFSRLSLLYSFRRFTPRERRIPRFTILVLVVLSVLFAVATIFLEVAGCRPFHVLTYTSAFMAKIRSGQYSCFAPREIYFFSAIFNCLFDIVLFAFPFVLLKFTDLKRKTRQGLYGLFAFGGVVVIISIVRIVYLYPMLNGWSIKKALPALIFTIVECNCIIIAACIPTLRPLWKLIRGRHSQHSHENHLVEEGNEQPEVNEIVEGGYGVRDNYYMPGVASSQPGTDDGPPCENQESTRRIRNKLQEKTSRDIDLEAADEKEKDPEDIQTGIAN